MLMLGQCHLSDCFVSHFLGMARLDLPEKHVEFALPQKEGQLMAISGELQEGDVDLNKFIGSAKFRVNLIYRDGSIDEGQWLPAREANWHVPGRGFVIMSGIQEDPGNKIDKINVSIIQGEGTKNPVREVNFYAGYVGSCP
jgi:hypothetical protein